MTTKTAQKSAGQRQPRIRYTKGRAYAEVQLSGQVFSLGRADDPDHRVKFAQLVSAWEARGRVPLEEDQEAPAVTVGGIVALYLAHLKARKGEAWISKEGGGGRVWYALETLRRLYGQKPAAAFDRAALEDVRCAMLEGGRWVDEVERGGKRVKVRQRSCCRGEANGRVAAIQRAFNWALGQKLVDAAQAHALATLERLERGDFGARENPGRQEVPRAVVEATLPFLPHPLDAVVRLLLATGARPSEVLGLRAGDLDTSNPEQWVAVLAKHKTAGHGKARVLVFEPEAIEVLRPFMLRRGDGFLFSPVEGMAEWRRRRSEHYRQMREGDAAGAGAQEGAPGNEGVGGGAAAAASAGGIGGAFQPAYDAHALAVAVRRAVRRANAERAAKRMPKLPHWAPYQIRHTTATDLACAASEAEAGALLGHSTAATTKRYVHREVERARAASRLLQQRRKAT